jgi:hypothetical protein
VLERAWNGHGRDLYSGQLHTSLLQTINSEPLCRKHGTSNQCTKGSIEALLQGIHSAELRVQLTRILARRALSRGWSQFMRTSHSVHNHPRILPKFASRPLLIHRYPLTIPCSTLKLRLLAGLDIPSGCSRLEALLSLTESRASCGDAHDCVRMVINGIALSYCRLAVI